MTVCDCKHEREGRCTLMPKVRVTFQEWQDSWHPMLPDALVMVTRWEHPPADAPCGQQAPREAVHRFVAENGLPSSNCLVCGVSYKHQTIPCAGKMVWGKADPPAAAPAPSEAAKAWKRKVMHDMAWMNKHSHDDLGILLDAGIAIIAAAEQRAESAERGLKVMRDTNANLAKCGGEYMQEAFDLRAKLAAMEKELFGARNDLLREGMERDAARGRAVEVLREVERAWHNERLDSSAPSVRDVVRQMIAAEEARGK